MYTRHMQTHREATLTLAIHPSYLEANNQNSCLPRWLSGKEYACQCQRQFYPWIAKIPWRRQWQPTPVFFPGTSHGHRSLVGHSPWGCKRVGHDLITEQQQQSEWQLEISLKTVLGTLQKGGHLEGFYGLADWEPLRYGKAASFEILTSKSPILHKLYALNVILRCCTQLLFAYRYFQSNCSVQENDH